MKRERDATRRLHWGQLMAIVIGFVIGFAAVMVDGAAVQMLPPTPIVEEMIIEDSIKHETETEVALITLCPTCSTTSTSHSEEETENVSSSSASSIDENVSDDLIFLTNRAPTEVPTEKESHTTDAADSASSSSSSEEEEELDETTPSGPVTPIDMSAFIALIPAHQVQAIVSNYFRHDREIRRAHTYFTSQFFAELKPQLVELPEVIAFVDYFNASGLDIYKLADSVVQATKPPAAILDNLAGGGLIQPIVNENNSTKELNGLHGLVDRVLDVLPQDQILATFFDKTEKDPQFAKLVDSIGKKKFSRILSNLQNSATIRSFIQEMHDNGIYIKRIVESLKSYFFLSTF